MRFRYDSEREEFERDPAGKLVPDPDGRPYRNWRPHIKQAGDIWDEIVASARLTGTVTAPELDRSRRAS
jgi:Cu(I)/Ag(I) efflux system membrane protein CusA/SilA